MSLKTSETQLELAVQANRFEGPIQQSYDAKTTTVSNLNLCKLGRNKWLYLVKLDRNN
jgi:hypothetical protein